MRIIALEEHFYTGEYIGFLRSNKGYPRLETVEDANHQKTERMWRSPTHFRKLSPYLMSKHLDIESGRLADMDKAGISMQVLSMGGPSVEELEISVGTTMAMKINNDLAKAISLHPDRFVGFATINPNEPNKAAEELERAVKDLGFKGLKINSHSRGEYLDDKKYWVIFEKAEMLGVPIYLHPKEPPPDMSKPFMKYPILATGMWGFATDAGLHAMRLICSGLFDAHPKLKIILGHLGEAIPFWLWRIDNRWIHNPDQFLKRNPGDYFRDNFLVTTSGMFGEQSFMSTYLTLGADKILFAVDYPFESNEEAVNFIEKIPICDSDKEKICHLNAERLLGLQ